MKIAIVGARDHGALEIVRAFVQGLPAGTIVVSGAARGVDRVAAAEASRLGLVVIELTPDWSTGRGAGFARNTDIVSAADQVHAFPWPGCRGTWDTIRKAFDAGKLAEIHHYRRIA